MVVIRLARAGKKKQAFYRIVVADSKRAVTAKFISIVGWFNPHTKEINLKKDEIAEWLGKGAVPSNSVAILLKKEGVKLPDWVQIKEKVAKKPEKVEEEKPEKAAPVAEETPAEESTVVEESEVETANEETPAEEAVSEEAPAEEKATEEVAETEAPAE